jgi:hypothetical protein
VSIRAAAARRAHARLQHVAHPEQARVAPAPRRRARQPDPVDAAAGALGGSFCKRFSGRRRAAGELGAVRAGRAGVGGGARSADGAEFVAAEGYCGWHFGVLCVCGCHFGVFVFVFVYLFVCLFVC